MKVNSNRTSKDVIVKTASDVFTPISLVLGFYVILHGHLSPGGGFQGGVLVAASVILIYLAYGHKEVSKKFNMDVIKKHEALGAIAFTVFGFCGLLYGSVFFANVFANIGNPGDLLSAGTIMFMNNSVGYKVLTGVGFLILLMIGLLAPDSEE